MSKMLEAALHYAQTYGIPVMPLRPHDKVPILKDWVHNASTDPEQIRRWWTERPSCNIGGVMGEYVCLDFDVDENGLYDSRDFLVEWERDHGKLPETATATTGRGGMHLFYKVDRDISKSENGELHIDIRGLGSQAMLAPSIHPNGNEVFWDLDPDDVGIAQADENVYALIDAVRPAKSKKEHAPVTVPTNKIQEGEGRNKFLYEQGCSARAKGADDEVIKAWLETLNDAKCKPPVDRYELNKIIGSVCSKPIGLSEEVKAAKRGRPRKFEHNKVAQKLIEEYGACLIDNTTPAIRTKDGSYSMGWDAFDSVIIDLHDDCTESNRREVKAYVKAKAESKRQSPAHLVAFTNGVLDVRSMTFRGWNDDDVIANVIPHRWNPDAASPELDRMIDRMACGDVATQMNLTEFIGVCMMRSVKQCPFFPVLIGEGSNGKSTYIGLLKDVVGPDNISGLQPKDIAQKFLGSHIVGKTANLGDDIASGYLDDRDCSIIKSVATGDIMFTDVKGGKGYYFEPYCTMVFSCNQFPRLADTTPGFMRRLFPIEFNAIFSREDEDYDPLIGEKMRQEETLEYACVIGIEGLRRVIAQNGPTPNTMSEAMKSSIASEGNTALQWFHDESIAAEYLIGMTKEEAYREYVDWCERNGYARTAMGAGTLAAQIGTYYRLKCAGIDHRDMPTGRKTVRVFERK